MSADSTGEYKRIYLGVKTKEAWNFGTSRKITENDLNSEINWYSGMSFDTAIISNIQIEYGLTATEYEPYSG